MDVLILIFFFLFLVWHWWICISGLLNEMLGSTKTGDSKSWKVCWCRNILIYDSLYSFWFWLNWSGENMFSIYLLPLYALMYFTVLIPINYGIISMTWILLNDIHSKSIDFFFFLKLKPTKIKISFEIWSKERRDNET